MRCQLRLLPEVELSEPAAVGDPRWASSPDVAMEPAEEVLQQPEQEEEGAGGGCALGAVAAAAGGRGAPADVEVKGRLVGRGCARRGVRAGGGGEHSEPRWRVTCGLASLQDQLLELISRDRAGGDSPAAGGGGASPGARRW